MYKCTFCKQSQRERTRPDMVVLETRRKDYPMREKAYPNEKNDPGGTGWEIVREIRSCPTCAAQWRAQHPIETYKVEEVS